MGGFNWGDHNWVYAYTIQPGDTVIEIGACNGDDVVFLSENVGETGRAIFIEPNPLFKEQLENIVTPYSNVTFIFKAICSFTGVSMFKAGHDEQGHLLHIPPYRPDYVGMYEFTVETITLDELISELGLTEINLLVMDVEGSEYEIFAGADKVFKIVKNIATAAYHKPGDLEKFQEIFREKGFNSFKIDTSGGPFVCLHAGK